MSRHTYSRFVFETSDYMRTFRHERFINNLSMNCDSCQSRVEEFEPYSHHWLADQDEQHLKLDLEQKLLLKRIEKERIETFLLCDESAVGRTNEFLLEAGMQAVPQLLRFLNFEASWLEVTIGFYVNVVKQRMFFETGSIKISHHLDIGETVDMLFSMLLERIGNYVLSQQRVPLEACTVKRLKVTVKRHWDGRLHLPLQYRVKNDSRLTDTSNKKPVDLELLTKSYMEYHGQRFGNFSPLLQVNLYCLRVCATSKEIYAVPYLLRSENVNSTPTFLIQTDVTGEYQGMHEIRNIRRFLKADLKDNTFECRQCKIHFSERSQYALHKLINCGHGFTISHIDVESMELHENCITLPKKFFKFAWFGISHSSSL